MTETRPTWYRVFAPTAAEVPPSALAEYLHSVGFAVEPHFKGDDLGWTSGELRFADGGPPVVLDRYLTAEDDLRADLNAFAAELEALGSGPAVTDVMRRVIQAQQLVALQQPDGGVEPRRSPVEVESLMLEVCRFLAGRTDGVFQIDGKGWFAADGGVLIREGC